jgi:hypothetical protein
MMHVHACRVAAGHALRAPVTCGPGPSAGRIGAGRQVGGVASFRFLLISNQSLCIP